MALASVAELAQRLGRTLTAATPDYVRAQADLDDVSAFAMTVSERDWDDEDVPADVKAVVLGAAKRKFQNPEGYRSQSAGDFSVERDTFTANLFTSFELDVLRRYRPGNGLGVISTTRGESLHGPLVPYRVEWPNGHQGATYWGGE